MKPKINKWWVAAFGITLIQVFLIIELTSDRAITSEGLQDIFGFVVSDRLMDGFFLVEAATFIIGIIGGLIGALRYKYKPIAGPCWFVFLFNALSIFWIFIAAAGSS